MEQICFFVFNLNNLRMFYSVTILAHSRNYLNLVFIILNFKLNC